MIACTLKGRSPLEVNISGSTNLGKEGYMPHEIHQAMEISKCMAQHDEQTQLEAFNSLLGAIESPNATPTQRGLYRIMLQWLANESTIPFLRGFCVGFKLGEENERYAAENRAERRKTSSVKRAVRGREMIGWKTKKRIEAAAPLFRHLTKEGASYEIAKVVGLSPGRVRQLLSELYPGKKWHASID